MLHDLVYVKYNQQLAQRYNIRDEIDLIVLNDIDECNGWLVGQGDDDNDNDIEEGGNELVFYDDATRNWANVYETSSVGEPIIYTRRQTTSKIKLPSSGDSIVIDSSYAFKKGPTATLSPTRKRKNKIKIGVGNELHDS